MTVCATIQDLRHTLRAASTTIGFVPTMGAMHPGHMRLLQVARQENDRVICSIFVNPLQFDRADDLERYPRTLDADLAICEQERVDVVFAPTAAELYPQEQLAFAEVPALERHLCGAFRPGHFRGVCTVVLKLLNIVGPQRAYFGEKDAQQVAIIRRMVQDLAVPVHIVTVGTVREPDGLAMSSRNKLLRPEERALAPRLYQALQAAADGLSSGERDLSRLRQTALDSLAPLRVEYFEFVDPGMLMPLDQLQGDVLIAAAAWLGQTRLIDNVTWHSD